MTYLRTTCLLPVFLIPFCVPSLGRDQRLMSLIQFTLINFLVPPISRQGASDCQVYPFLLPKDCCFPSMGLRLSLGSYIWCLLPWSSPKFPLQVRIPNSCQFHHQLQSPLPTPSITETKRSTISRDRDKNHSRNSMLPTSLRTMYLILS